MDEPWDGIDNDEVVIEFTADAELAAEVDGRPWAVCPNGHVAWLRPSDGALWCEACAPGGMAWYRDFAGYIYPRRDAA